MPRNAFILPSSIVETRGWHEAHEERRKIIREWMAFPKDKRQTKEQLEAFAKNAMRRIPFSRDPYRQIMTWLLPRTGKP